MPLYEYQCQQCHRHTEKRQKFSDPEITQCPHCGGLLVRVISAPNIAFKGGGWYKDLYSSPKPAAGGEAKAEAGGESKSDNAASKDAPPKASATSSDSSGSTTSSAPSAASAPAAAAPSTAASKD